MFFKRLIRWLAGFPAPYALGLLWWVEVTVLMCTITGAYLLSNFIFENIKTSMELWLFPIEQVIYLVVFYIMHFEFTNTSLLMEALVHIERMGGRDLVDGLYNKAIRDSEDLAKLNPGGKKEIIPNPFGPPDRIRASAGAFRIRYFIVLPTVAILYLLSFASTIYRIFARQIQTWEPSQAVFAALVAVAMSTICYWLLMSFLPGYVSVRRIIGHKPSEGE
jgi:hypothetical protein